MTKAEVEAKIQEIISKDERYKDAKITITFKDKDNAHRSKDQATARREV